MDGCEAGQGRRRIAVVGAGITGLSAAWLLALRHDVTLFEAEPRLGGHSNTVNADVGGRIVPVDTGFIVYNEPSYPNLVALFKHLGVETVASTMSFAVSIDDGAIEYSGTGLNGVFAQRRNILRPAHWRMTADIVRFHREARVLARDGGRDPSLTLGEWLSRQGYSRVFITQHILPMAAAIWSAPTDVMLGFPAESFARFFDNHGLLQAYAQPVWRTVAGGSRTYVERLRAAFGGRVVAGDAVTAVARDGRGADVVRASGARERFDRVALCCHADEALRLLEAPSIDERRVLGAFSYSRNRAVLHTDPAFMPKLKRVWSSWNYLSRSATEDREGPLMVSYWMNSLQPLATPTPLFVTLNPDRPVAAGAELAAFDYAHPVFDTAALKAQAELQQIQGVHAVWFGGAYCGYGFHEDGLQAGLAIAEDMTSDGAAVVRPWRVAADSGRLAWRPRAPVTRITAVAG